ncbi:MAG: YggS family pyridoxal phosphate-dependent enzyme [Clostridia bacterium]|nr:YggS family pyridoxal phosphate-dependent enzyme [Clostridia bacterium]
MNIEENVKNLLNGLSENPFGEKVTLVAAVKTQTPSNINAAINAGITDIGDNRVQEFCEKYDKITGNPKRHFIGHLQTNKIKYLLGKVDLYHSVDRMNLAEELSSLGEKRGVTSEILLQVNIGNEATKGGFDYSEIFDVYKKVKALPNLKIRGLMAMLPDSDDNKLLCTLAHRMRDAYDALKSADENICALSMGMSGDYRLCIDAGSNMIRLGTAIFGTRNYN